MTDDANGPLRRLDALGATTDDAFARIRARHAERMQCRAGCSACCRARLSVTRVEQAALERGLETLDAARRDELAARSRDPSRETCPALDDDGRCAVYDFRPLICRSFGIPLRRRRDVPLIHPSTVDACDLNFAGTRLRTLPAEDVFDQTALESALDAIDRDHCDEHGLPQRERIPLAAILGGSVTIARGPAARPAAPAPSRARRSRR